MISSAWDVNTSTIVVAFTHKELGDDRGKHHAPLVFLLLIIIIIIIVVVVLLLFVLLVLPVLGMVLLVETPATVAAGPLDQVVSTRLHLDPAPRSAAV